MKRLLCAALILIMIAAMTVVAASADSAPAETGASVLTVTANGANPVQVEVGNEFIVRVGLKASDEKILNGQIHMEYDPAYVAFDPHMIYADYFEEDAMEAYSFPSSIYTSGLVINYSNPGIINYNFTKARGVAVFNSTDALFARFRFKATAAGKTDITHIIQYMIDVNDQRIYYANEPCEGADPEMKITIEPAAACIGDADNDNEVTILDATFAQRVAAGADLSYDAAKADVTGDKALSLKDAIVIRKYLAGIDTGSGCGEYQFTSEKA